MDWRKEEEEQSKVDRTQHNPTVFIDLAIGDGELTAEQLAHVEAIRDAYQQVALEAYEKVKAEQKDLQRDSE